MDIQVSSEQGGFAYILIAESLSPVPISLVDIHAALELSPSSAAILSQAGLLSTPTATLAYTPNQVPPGSLAFVQALVAEFGPAGTFIGFTNSVETQIP